MTLIQKFKNGRLHIYVRQDMYKGKLKSENWVGRTFLDKKQRVFSSGTKNFEEAKVILEKWYDDLESGVLDQKNEENTQVSEIPSDSTPAQVAPLEQDNKVAENTVIEKIIKPKEDEAKSSSILDKIKNAKFDLSFLKKTNFLIISSSLNDKTESFFNLDRLIKLRKNSIIVNIARGELVDEKAIVKLIKNNHILKYSTDVLSNESEILNKKNSLIELSRTNKNIIISHGRGRARL